jgi:diacylglycerol kinase
MVPCGLIHRSRHGSRGLQHLTDLVSRGHHPLAGKAKDVAAGAVLLTAIGAVAVGLLVFLPKITALF